jgi:para-aminobenzoate synthetase component 1
MARPLIYEIPNARSPESLVGKLQGEAGVVLLRSSLFDSPQTRYSFVAARPFLTFRSFGSRCEIVSKRGTHIEFGDPWRRLEELLARYEMLDEIDLPLPLGGCFGYWGYELKNFVEPKLSRRAVSDLEWPDSHLGFYSSLVAFDHRLGKSWIIATGLDEDGSRSSDRAQAEIDFWQELMSKPALRTAVDRSSGALPCGAATDKALEVSSNLTQADFISRVKRAQDYIRSGDIYQVNLSHRLAARFGGSARDLFENLGATSPAPFGAFLDCGEFHIVSSSPELFLRMSGSRVETRPIKGTRPRGADVTRDAQLAYELQTSSKELAELVMITDLLRNDLGRVCEFGSVQVSELARLERFAQVQHLVSVVEGCLRPEVPHAAALAACFPGGSITGAPKFRAMEIIDELEPIARGPYTGALGYLGFNRESQLSIIIRAALHRNDCAYFNVGAGIVADSVPEAEYEETLDKARGFLKSLRVNETASLRLLA